MFASVTKMLGMNRPRQHFMALSQSCSETEAGSEVVAISSRTCMAPSVRFAGDGRTGM